MFIDPQLDQILGSTQHKAVAVTTKNFGNELMQNFGSDPLEILGNGLNIALKNAFIPQHLDLTAVLERNENLQPLNKNLLQN